MAASQLNTGLILGVGAFLASLVIVLTYKRRRVYTSNVAKVAKLIIYPVKSMPGIEVDHLEIVSSGAKYGKWRDRSFIILNEDNRMITQRTEPRLALIKLTFEDDALVLMSPGYGSVRVPFKTEISPEDKVISFRVWSKDTEGVYSGDETSNWISTFLGKESIKLAQHLPSLKMCPSTSIENLKQVYDNKNKILFQDLCPYLVINQESIAELNSKLSSDQKPTDHRNWRPNILVENCPAYSEDRWDFLRTPNIELKATKLCDRCAFPTIDPDTGIKDNTLTDSYKKIRPTWTEDQKKYYGEKVLFGNNFSVAESGILRVGDVLDAVVSSTDRL
ncbi:Mitochondrial amidoxime-reducing component 1 [Halotydeus destructor]|nr:Mitochondrial amidoxime-reducing component 1 [Halotydeus destructor]